MNYIYVEELCTEILYTVIRVFTVKCYVHIHIGLLVDLLQLSYYCTLYGMFYALYFLKFLTCTS